MILIKGTMNPLGMGLSAEAFEKIVLITAKNSLMVLRKQHHNSWT